MRILHVLDHSLPLHSGYTFRSAAIFRAQRARGWETFHLTAPRQGKVEAMKEDAEGFTFYRTRYGGGSKIPVLREYAEMAATTRRLLEVAKELKPDIVHAHSPVLTAVPALRVARKLGIPMVYEVRSFWEDAAVDHGTTNEGSPRYVATRALETWVLKRVDAAFTICEGLRNDIISRGIVPEKITVIPNAVAAAEFTVPPAAQVGELKASLGLTGKLVIGFVGSFYGYEGLGVLLDALPAIQKAYPHAALLLVGGGPQEARLRERSVALGVNNVIFSGRVPHAKVDQYYHVIDVLAYPRRSMRLTELVTPLKPLEAMIQRRRFIASDVGGHRELVEHERTGLLFKADGPQALATTLIEGLKTPEKWASIVEAGYTYASKERTWDASVARHAAVYERVLAAANPRRKS